MASACILRGAQSKAVFWALVFTILFVGTSQQDSSDNVATTIAPAARTEASTASISSTKATHDDFQATATVPSVAAATSTAVVANSSQSITAEPTTFKNAEPTLSTEQYVESPNATLADEHHNSTAREMERNGTDSAMRLEAEPDSENMTTTTQIMSPAVTQPSTVALPDMSSEPHMPKDIKVMVTCVTKVPDKDENHKCLQFKDPITCEDFKDTKMYLAEMLCNFSQHIISSGLCHIKLSPSDTDPRCLLLNTDIYGNSMELSESTKAALKQHGVELTSNQSSKPRTTLIALVTTGLVVAALILCGYFLSNRQSWSPGSRRLDEDYAGNDSPDNTLISVAARDQSGQGDKSNLKGGIQENGTGQAVTPTATNGHSNKPHVVADTEL